MKAIVVDDDGVYHLLIGLNRENIKALLNGDVLTLSGGAAPLNENSDIVFVFAETDEELGPAISARGCPRPVALPAPRREIATGSEVAPRIR